MRLKLSLFFGFLAITSQGLSQVQVSTKTGDIWRTVPLVDAHFHFMRFMSPEDLLARIDRHNITNVISAGADGNPQIGHPNTRDGNAYKIIGNRFLPAVGNAETVSPERIEGASFFTAPDSKERPLALQKIQELLAKEPRTLGEMFPNAEKSTADPMRRRRVPVDGPLFQELAPIAIRFNRPMALHMEWHPESVEGLGRLLQQWPALQVVLSHCGKTTRANDIRLFFERHQNVVCDLSYRSLPQEANDYKRFPERTIFWSAADNRPAFLEPSWKKLIEEMPTRFMIGIDDTHDWNEYDEVVRSIREGLLANLNPSIVPQVAYINAQRVFRLLN